MAKRSRMSKYSRRRAIDGQKNRTVWAFAVAIIAFVLLSVAVSVAVGLALGDKADGIEPKNEYEFPQYEYSSGNKTVRPVDAYAYSFGKDPGAYTAAGITDLSVCLRAFDGVLSYTSLIGADTIEDDSDTLEHHVEYIHQNGGRVCAYFYVSSFYEKNVHMKDLYASYEIALINEAARSGVDDIMLVGISVDEDNIDSVEAFVARAAAAAENAVLGVLVSPETVKLTEDNVYLAARVRSVCDFIALDLRSLSSDADKVGDGSEDAEKSELERLLDEMEYYVSSYKMRIVLSKNNSELYDSLKALGVCNIQIIEE